MFPLNIPRRALARLFVDAALVGCAMTGMGLALAAPLVADLAVQVRSATLPNRR